MSIETASRPGGLVVARSGARGGIMAAFDTGQWTNAGLLFASNRAAGKEIAPLRRMRVRNALQAGIQRQTLGGEDRCVRECAVCDAHLLPGRIAILSGPLFNG